jgi:hypothetical protein
MKKPFPKKSNYPPPSQRGAQVVDETRIKKLTEIANKSKTGPGYGVGS